MTWVINLSTVHIEDYAHAWNFCKLLYFLPTSMFAKIPGIGIIFDVDQPKVYLPEKSLENV
jgi:hypothetical protein